MTFKEFTLYHALSLCWFIYLSNSIGLPKFRSNSSPMKKLLKLEELFCLILAFYLFLDLNYAWWWFFVLFLTPDLSMVGYLLNSRVGALLYNVVHHKGVAIAIYLVGGYFNLQLLQLIGLILFGHSSMDRILGYGLKYPDAFAHTHVGMIGKQAKVESVSVFDSV